MKPTFYSEHLTLFLLLTVFMTSCDFDKKESNTTKQLIVENDSVKYNNGDLKNFKAASFNDTIKIVKLYNFSSLDVKDSFSLTIPSGLISATKSHFTVKTSAGTIIYSETFDTSYFLKGIYEPDTIPRQGGQEVYEAYIENYKNSITRNQYEKYAYENITKFFNDIFVRPSQFKDMEDIGSIVDKGLYQSVLDNKNSKVFWLPCFTCDEGSNYISYSRIKEKASIIFTTD